MTTNRVVAVVVTYHPNAASLARLFALITPQVIHTIQVDNTDGLPSLIQARGSGITLLQLGTNTGIGHAQNLGIAQAQQMGATHVLLLDQDSLPSTDLVAGLLKALTTTGASHPPIAAIGPVCRDIKTGSIIPLIQLKGWRIRRVVPSQTDAPLPVAYMPASGTLIPMEMLARVGLMRAEFFIDRVDMEWCLRASHMGFSVWIDPRVEMMHDQGTHTVELLGRTMYIGQGFRCYFHVRNSLVMALRAHIPFVWRIDQLLKIPGYVLFYSATSQHGRLRMAKLLLTALADGLRGRMGRGRYTRHPFS